MDGEGTANSGRELRKVFFYFKFSPFRLTQVIQMAYEILLKKVKAFFYLLIDLIT